MEIKKLIDLIKHYIESPIIDKEGKLIPEAWGIAEIKICATLLAGSTDFLNMSKYLKVKEGKNNELVYELKLLKPQRLLIFTDDEKKLNKKDDWKKEGIWIFNNEKELETHIKGKGSSPIVSPALFLNEKDKNLNENFLPFLPFRIIEEKIPFSKDQEKLIEQAYAKWLENKWLKNNKKVAVVIYTDEEVVGVWEKWEEILEKFNSINDKFKMYLMDKDKKLFPDIDNFSLLKSGGYKIALWDRHGGSNLTEKLEENDFLFEFDKLSPDFKIIYTSTPTYELLFNIIEAALLRVLIIDERLAERMTDVIGDENMYLLNTRFGVAKDGGILIASHLNNKALHSSIKDKCFNIEVKINRNIEINNIDNFDIVIIHQGILDKLKERYEIDCSIENFLNAFKKKNIDVIIDSGRGIPPQLQKGALAKEKFLPFSLLSHYVLGSKIAKIALTQVILKLTRRAQ